MCVGVHVHALSDCGGLEQKIDTSFMAQYKNMKLHLALLSIMIGKRENISHDKADLYLHFYISAMNTLFISIYVI